VHCGRLAAETAKSAFPAALAAATPRLAALRIWLRANEMCINTSRAAKDGDLAGPQLANRDFAISRAIASKACTRVAPLLAA
jgi:hypothetical protein